MEESKAENEDRCVCAEVGWWHFGEGLRQSSQMPLYWVGGLTEYVKVVILLP